MCAFTNQCFSSNKLHIKITLENGTEAPSNPSKKIKNLLSMTNPDTGRGRGGASAISYPEGKEDQLEKTTFPARSLQLSIERSSLLKYPSVLYRVKLEYYLQSSILNKQ